MVYIYILIDPVTNQIRYVGKTNNPYIRLRAHKNPCRDANTHKRNWINKLRRCGYKPEMEIVDEVHVSEWKYWEKFWIAYYKYLGCDLINLTWGGDGLTFGNQTSFKKGDRCKPVVGFDKYGNRVFEFNSASDASEALRVGRSTIAACCSGNNPCKTIKNLAWFYKIEIYNSPNEELQQKINQRFERIHLPNGGQFQKGVISARSKHVVVEDIQTGKIVTFPSGTKAGAELGVCQSAISWAISYNKLLLKKYKVGYV